MASKIIRVLKYTLFYVIINLTYLNALSLVGSVLMIYNTSNRQEKVTSRAVTFYIISTVSIKDTRNNLIPYVRNVSQFLLLNI